MIRHSILCISMLCSGAYLHAITLESDVLQVIDGTVLAWDSVCTIKKYQHQIRHFINLKRTIGQEIYNLFDIAIREKNKTLTELEQQAFEPIIQEFIAFSESFLATLNPVKKALAPLIQEFCTKRGRQHSTLLLWISAENGTEEIVFRKHVKTYRSLGEICLDLLNLTDDILNSCPKAMQSYHSFFDRVNNIEPLVDALLATDHITISHSGVLYHELVRYIAEHYHEQEHVTAEKTARLYHDYNVKKRI